jgi:alkyl hydroperoxide reductase subunit AhpF
MSLLSEPDRQQLREMFAELTNPVRLLFFTQTLGCETCLPTREILDEIASLSDKIAIDEHNLILDRDSAAEFGIDRAPAIVVSTERGTGIRFYGAPAGYEFLSLIEAIQIASRGDSGLSEESRALVATVAQPMSIQVFVTPT